MHWADPAWSTSSEREGRHFHIHRADYISTISAPMDLHDLMLEPIKHALCASQLKNIEDSSEVVGVSYIIANAQDRNGIHDIAGLSYT